MISTAADIQETIRTWAKQFDAKIEKFFAPGSGDPDELVGAIRYSLVAPGKRLRPFLVDRCYRLAGGRGDGADHLGVAVECLHVFTLIHDDLPDMDNADLRRGQLANHKVHGEALAILAGDALLAFGLELAAREDSDPARALRIVRELASAIGSSGVIGGQVIDMSSEDKPSDLELTRDIHERKTARLFQACCRVGALAANADDQTFNKLADYGLHLGTAFQITDDLLDATGATESLGKRARQDAGRQKQTYPDAVGVEESRRLGREVVLKAVAALDSFASDADELRELAHYVLSRTY